MKRPQLVSQGTLNRILRDAEQAWKKRDFQANIDLLERASKLAPGDPGILLQLGRMHGLRWDYAAAENCFERAIRFAPRKAEFLLMVGIQCRDFRNPGLAAQYFKRTTETPGASAESFAHLAELNERLRRTEDAEILIDRALTMKPDCGLALLARARLDRQSGKLELAERNLRSLVAGSEKEVRIRAGYELGSVLDRQGRYEEAMAAFLAAKNLVRPDAATFLAELRVIRTRLGTMKAQLNPAQLHRWLGTHQALKDRRRISLLCGHPRSGTTLLEQVLDSHPDVVSAEETEVFQDYAYTPLVGKRSEESYMLPVLEEATPEQLFASRRDYLEAMERLLGEPIDNRLLVDKNPSLTFLIPAVLRVFPETKLLIALRDPRDVCLSCFMQPFYPISQVTSAYLDLADTVAEYASVMEVWIKLLPILTGHYLQIRYETMVDHLEETARQVLEFLTLPWNPEVLQFDRHAREKLVRSPTYADVAQPVFKRAVGRWQHYERYMEPHLNTLAPYIEQLGY